ncbi:NAD-dependent epimerase/dehydratase family protein [Paenibacillus cymbidii]|uniref:NAD-dependent epimerase/dehydratase family protein n=1 Tax=Paenibacillus cymbidii TaxID=1639034 RepID=UPI001436B1AB|nr:NAD-dependent epimerase/dehydratase family protein [Paenibacillus cymbidii]
MTPTGQVKKVLVMGGTGAMGVYLVPELAALGYRVDVVSLDQVISGNSNIAYIQANAKDDSFLRKLLANKYDAIVDFMYYSRKEFLNRYELLLDNTSHYIYLSSYRVYANSDSPIKETSYRLVDVSDDMEFLATEDYALNKARQENMLQYSRFANWTIVRPAITYSKLRYQLVTLEANTVVHRARNNLPIVLPQEAMPVQATMSWAGDVARLMSRLVLNPAAYRDIFTLATSEHRTWGEIAGYYKAIIGLDYITVDTETYLSFFDPAVAKAARYQLLYDRCFNRVVDNSKVLQATGLKQDDFATIQGGLRQEVSALPDNAVWEDSRVNERMNKYVEGVLQ